VEPGPSRSPQGLDGGMGSEIENCQIAWSGGWSNVMTIQLRNVGAVEAREEGMVAMFSFCHF